VFISKKEIFSRTRMPISIKLGTNHPWIKRILSYSNKGPGPQRILSYSNKGPGPLQMGDKYKNA
jgi:hypothetical protein